jgi:hypothetical protein
VLRMLGYGYSPEQVVAEVDISRRSLLRWQQEPWFEPALVASCTPALRAVLVRADETPTTLRRLSVPQRWAVLWLAKGQTTHWTSQCSLWHLVNHIEHAAVLDWCRRWWFNRALNEMLELLGFEDQSHLRIQLLPAREPEPSTELRKRWSEIRWDRRLARRIAGNQKRLATLGREGRRAMTAAATEAARAKFHGTRKPYRWRPGMPWTASSVTITLS